MTVRLTLVALSCIAASVACSEGSEGDVMMTSEQRFVPDTITASVDVPVVFVNESGEVHTVTAEQGGLPEGGTYFASGGFESEDEARSSPSDGFILEGETFEVEFDAPGTYRYFCIPHEASGMKGTIIVEE